jgi:uncharacterized membrane protein YgcG
MSVRQECSRVGRVAIAGAALIATVAAGIPDRPAAAQAASGYSYAQPTTPNYSYQQAPAAAPYSNYYYQQPAATQPYYPSYSYNPYSNPYSSYYPYYSYYNPYYWPYYGYPGYWPVGFGLGWGWGGWGWGGGCWNCGFRGGFRGGGGGFHGGGFRGGGGFHGGGGRR